MGLGTENILTKERLTQLYWVEQLSQPEIVEQYGVTRCALKYWFGKYGIPTRSTSEASRISISRGRNRGVYRWKLECVPSEELRRLYWDECLSCVDIAERYGVESHTVANYLKHVGIPRRTPSEYMKLAYASGKMDEKHYATGKDHHNWNGGRQISNGYIGLFIPTHHRANARGYVLEHLVVWEKTHGKRLPKGWVIHHLNGIKDDNRAENLKAMPTSRHDRYIPILKERILELERVVAQLRAEIDGLKGTQEA